MSAAFGSEAPGTTIPVPAEQNEVARIFILAKSNDILGEFAAQSLGMRSQSFGQALGYSGFPVGMMPRDSAVGCTMQHTGDVPAFNEPASEGRLLRVIDRFDKVEMADRPRSRDGKALSALYRKCVH